jgi:hypothetical protein
MVFQALAGWALAQAPPITVGTPATATATPSLLGIPTGATIPRVVASNPSNGNTNANAFQTVITIDWDQPMDVATFFWPIPNSPDFPYVTGNPTWSNGNRRVSLPVKLVPNTTYRIPINTNNQLVFRSAQGVPANPGLISFTTGGPVETGSASVSSFHGTPAPRGTPRSVSRTPIPGTGSAATPFPTAARLYRTAATPTPTAVSGTGAANLNVLKTGGATPTPSPTPRRTRGTPFKPGATPTP